MSVVAGLARWPGSLTWGLSEWGLRVRGNVNLGADNSDSCHTYDYFSC